MKIHQAPLAEAAAIGCAIADPTLASELRESWFWSEEHSAVAKAIASLAAEGKAIDETYVTLRAGISLSEAVARCIEACHSPAAFPTWREILESRAQLRRATEFHSAALARLDALPDTEPPDGEREVLGAIESDFVALGARNTAPDDVSAADGIGDLFDALERGAEAPALQTGLGGLDRILRIRPGQFIVLAARPSVGKSALAGRIVEHALMNLRRPVGWFSLEMDRAEVLRRMASSLSGVPFDDFTDPSSDQQPRIIDALGQLKAAPLRICDRGGLTISTLASMARRWKVRHGTELLVVDYLGLLRADSPFRNRYESVTEISQALKALARNLRTTVLCLAQLNRAGVGGDTSDDRPRLHHLRDSGSIEQDADAVILLHPTGYENGQRQVSAYVEKQRNGPLGEAKLSLHGPTMRFESVSPILSCDIPPHHK